MNNLKTSFAKLLFFVLAGILFVWSGRLTFSLVSTLLPDMQFAPAFAIILFDGGVIVWLMLFINGSSGIGQRLTSIVLVLLDLAGIGMVAMLELYLSGQTLSVIPEGIADLAVPTVAVYTLINILGVVAYHLSDPKAATAITIQVQKDKVQAAGLKSLEQKMDVIGDQLANELGEELKNSVLAELRNSSSNGTAKNSQKQGVKE